MVHPFVQQLGEEILSHCEQQNRRHFLLVSALRGEGVLSLYTAIIDYFHQQCPGRVVDGRNEFPRALDEGQILITPCDGLLEDKRGVAAAVRADCAVVVVRCNSTERSQLHSIVELLVRHDVELLGGVMTGSLEARSLSWYRKLLGWCGGFSR